MKMMMMGDDDKQQTINSKWMMTKEWKNRPEFSWQSIPMKYIYEKRKHQQFKIKCCVFFCGAFTRDKTLEEHEFCYFLFCFEFELRAKKKNANHEKSEWKKINETNNMNTQNIHTYIIYTHNNIFCPVEIMIYGSTW